MIGLGAQHTLKIEFHLVHRTVISACAFFFVTSVVMADESVTVENAWGEYVWGEGVNVVRPCGQELDYWIEASKADQKRLVDEYRKLSNKPYMPIYIKFSGQTLDKELDGFAADYDGLMQVHEITQIQAVVPSACAGTLNSSTSND